MNSGYEMTTETTMILNLTELSTEPIHSQISRQVRAKILAGGVATGTELPSPRVFARQQRVSAISVQRAFEDLAAEGWLRPRRDGGFEVAPVSEERRRDLAQQRIPIGFAGNRGMGAITVGTIRLSGASDDAFADFGTGPPSRDLPLTLESFRAPDNDTKDALQPLETAWAAYCGGAP